jgi:hypothetical protein
MVAPSASSGETERNSMDTVGAHALLLENQTAKNHPRLSLHVIAYRFLFQSPVPFHHLRLTPRRPGECSYAGELLRVARWRRAPPLSP